MPAKVRRVDFWPDEWLGGTNKLSDAECGVYIRACALIYSHGGPITRADLRDACKSRGKWFERSLDTLIRLGKLIAVDAERLDQARCQAELQRAQKRIEAAREGASARWGNNTDQRHQRDINATLNLHQPEAKTSVSNDIDDAPAMLTKNRQSQEEGLRFKNLKGDLGFASEAGEPEPWVPHQATAEEIAEVERITIETVAMLRAATPVRHRNAIHDPTAYRTAVKDAKRNQWLNGLAQFVSHALDGGARMAAWEAIEQARAAGSREATPADVRRAVDALSRLRETGADYAEAAE